MDIYTTTHYGFETDCIIFNWVTIHNIKAYLVLVGVDTKNPRFIYQPQWIVNEVQKSGVKGILSLKDIILLAKATKGTVPLIMRPAVDTVFETLYKKYSNEQRRLHSCNKIKKAWLHVYYNPWHDVCKRRLQKEFEELDSLMIV
jgi:hypothetical protein